MVASLRPSRRTNLALLVLLLAAFLTGWLAFGVGTSPATRIVTTLHGMLGLGMVLLVPWKSVVVRRGLRRHRPHGDALLLAAAVATSIVAGVVHSTVGPLAGAGISALDVHVGAAIVAVPVVVLHLLRRPQPVRRTDFSRRTLLRGLALAGGAALAYGMVEAATGAARLPGAGRRGTGSYEAGSGEPARMPVTQWFTDSVPAAGERSHVVRVVVPGRSPQHIAHGDLVAAADTTVEAVLDCTGGWWAVQTWRGVPLDRLLGRTEGRSIVVRSVTGYSRRFPVEDAAALLLATHVAERPLSPGHGSPVRLVAPGRRGFWWVKWVDQVSVDDEPWWWQPPFPLQ